MTVTNESGGRLNAFANEPEINVISSKARNNNQIQFFASIVALALISIIGSYLIIK